MTSHWIVVSGFLCGALAGGAARYGRLCTMSAVEDAIVARDWRGAKAWGLAIAVAIAVTQSLAALRFVDLSRSLYVGSHVHWLGAMFGGGLFGLGMTLVGTCSFGLLVRAGGGDLRAGMTSLVVGIIAIAATAGALAPLREPLLGLGRLDLAPLGGATIDALVRRHWSPAAALGVTAAIVATLAIVAGLDRRLRARPRLLVSAALMGLAVAGAWASTTYAVDMFLIERIESLSFVAPVGRGLGQFMMDAFRGAGFGVATVAGVVAASAIVAMKRREFRWEAFDDPLEMRRHLAGATLMGIGGVLAQGCTIGQGLGASSALAVTAPMFLVSLLAGAKLGLLHLIEGRSLWRLGRR